MAQAETPPILVRNSSSSGSPSQRARAPVATIRVSARIRPSPSKREAKGPLAQLDRLHRSRGELRAEALRLLAHLLHQLGTQDALGEARVVVDVGGEHELAAGHVGGIVAASALHDQRLAGSARDA